MTSVRALVEANHPGDPQEEAGGEFSRAAEAQVEPGALIEVLGAQAEDQQQQHPTAKAGQKQAQAQQHQGVSSS